jgi:TonB family protein
MFLVLPGPFLKDDEPEPVEIVFYSPEELDRPVELPPELPEPEPIPEPEPEPEPVAIVELKPVEPSPEPPMPEPPVKPVERIVRSEPVAKPEVAPKPDIRTDVFKSETPAEPTAVASRREARTVGFGETEPQPTPPVRSRPDGAVKVAGGFSDDAPVTQEAPTGQPNTRVVANGSFSDGAMAVPRQGTPPRRSTTVTRTAFVSEAAGEPATERATSEVTRGGFQDEAAPTRATSKRKLSVEVEDPDTPVEIVSKPRPLYTEQARERHIEGEVVLEVTFVATGQLRVLRVLGSLGHGLDEAAVEAAKKIEFTPARRNGRPVDHTATLRVVFRLA